MKPAFLTASLLSFAFVQPALAQDEKPLSETCPNLTVEEIDGIENFTGEFGETAIYARSYCVSVEEAHRRIELQLRGSIGPRTEPGPPPVPDAPDANIGAIQGTLHQNEPDTFAGLWIQHEPTYGVVVAFTRDATTTLAKYTSDPLYIPVERPGPTVIELRATQKRIADEMIRLGINWYGAGSNIMTGVVEIELGQSADPIRAAAARGEFDLPDYVMFKEPAPFPVAAPPVPAGDTRVKSFPQFAKRTDGGMSTLVGVQDVPARLELRDGCLWLLPDGEEPRIAVWEQHEALDLTDPNRIAVINLFSGAKVYADSDVVLMGLQPNEGRPPSEMVGNQGCPGPYRVVRGIVPREQWDRERREAAISGRERELGNRAAAEADYEQDMERVAQLRAWRDSALIKHGDIVAAIGIDENQGTAHMFHTDAATKDTLVIEALQPYVTAQIVPQGFAALEEARLTAVAVLDRAGVDAQVLIEPLGGYVSVRPDALIALTEAAAHSGLAFPKLARIETDWQGPIYNTELASRRDPESIWYPLEAHPDFAAIRALVAETPIMRPEPPLSGTTQDRWVARKPSRAGSLQQTHFVIAYGNTLSDILALRRAGFDPIEALEDMNGRQTVEKRALTATDVVIAEPVGIDTADSGADGFSSSVRWKVLEVLKGDAEVGVELRQRMASGERQSDNGELVYGQAMDEPFLMAGLPNSLESGSRWVLHLNDALYRHAAFVNGGEGAPRAEGEWYVSVSSMSPARIGEDGIARPVTLYPEPISVDELRMRLEPIQKALRLQADGAET
ncbi:MAG: hypothetical protein V7676_17185 [Parasphingorhabdus sp.]|uniref:hypothetical protein n=1 Tax=Parasphingorhabdus sp. TaxID=2709688 RepID=UPI003002E18C